MIRAYWQQLNEREQWSLLIGGSLFICYLLYLMIFAPLSSAVATKDALLQEKQNTLAWMKKAEKEFPKTGHHAQKVENGALLSMIAAQCQSPGFKSFPYKMNQNSSGDIQLSFDTIPYNTVIRWLQQFSQQYQIKIKSLRIQQTSVAGVIQFNLTVGAINDFH